jgi:rod shape-determining protein MreC
MDWEIYERYRATFLLLGIILTSFLMMAFQKSPAVRSLRMILVSTTTPAQSFLSRIKASDEAISAQTESVPSEPSPLAASMPAPTDMQRSLHTLSEENKRLRTLLDLKEHRWPRAIAAHVAGRDPQRWFQEIVIDKGENQGLAVDDPVIAVVGDRDALVGRIVEAGPEVSKIMLVQDPLSAVAATVEGKASEDGVVEGNNQHDLTLKYLDRSSQVKIGDAVVTSGLGTTFPSGIPIGIIEDLSLDPRQLFLQARLRPAIQGVSIHWVLILVDRQRKVVER